MPPQIRPTRVDPATGEKREWNGSTWVLPAGEATGGGPSMPMLNLPPGPHNPDDPNSGARNSEILKQFLTLAGGAAGGLVLGPPGALLGGAAGRALGHAPEAALRMPTDSTFVGDAAFGAGEGLTNELLPKFAGRIIGAGGTGLKTLGRMAFDNPEWSPWLRARVAAMRGAGAGYVGGPAVGTVASMGPMVASEAGKRLETTGAKMGTGTLSERLGSGLEALKARLWGEPALTHADALAGGAERYAGAKRAGALQDAAAERGSGVSSFREYTPDIPVTPRPVTPATDIYGDPAGLERRTQLYHTSVDAGMEPSTASQIILGEPRPAGSATWGPDPSMEALTRKVTPRPVTDRRAAELVNTFGGTGGKPAAAPTARYGFEWPDVGTQYHVQGGPFDRSTVGAGRLRELGIDVPATPDLGAIDVGVSNNTLDALNRRINTGELPQSAFLDSLRGTTAPAAAAVTPAVPEAARTARGVAEKLKPIGNANDLQPGDFMDALRRSLGLKND